MNFNRHLAVFGGSFNPPHLGHLEAVTGLLHEPGVARVMVVPSFGTPLKEARVSYEDRLEMARIAFSGIAEVSDIEGRSKIQFTWELLEALAPKNPNLAFVIGTDQFRNLGRWSRYPHVLGLCDWIVLLRKPDTRDSIGAALTAYQQEGILTSTADPHAFLVCGSGRTLRIVETPALEASSTRIRENFAMSRKDEAKARIPAPVLEWIERKHLYGT